MPLEDFVEVYSVRDLLGVGAFGVVLQVKNKVTNERSALKIIPKEKLSKHALSILKNESTIMAQMRHPSVVAFKRIFENAKFIILEMELIRGGQLKQVFKRVDSDGKPQAMTDLEASKIIKSLLEGVAYIHERSIIHRDIKPENILLTEASQSCTEVKIIDFGLSAEFNLRLGKDATEKAGTLIYMAPEQVALENYSKKVDIWPVGIIMYQLLTNGKHPCFNKGESSNEYIQKMRNIDSKPLKWEFNENFSELAKDFFLKLCSYPPNQRYDANRALMHPWLTRNERDEIPLTRKQEILNFARGIDLRKAMRVAYFTSQMKLQFSN